MTDVGPAAGPFARFVAIDWSGAKGRRYAGIAVAECPAGTAAPRLVDGPGGWWSRSAVHDWLLDSLARGPALVGIDCAFSLPFAVAGRYFADPEAATVFDLWDLVERVTAGQPDFLGGPFAEHPDFAGDFWRSGLQPDWYRDPHRLTERVCRADGYGSPQSPYKLIGSKQVGRGALAGMRMLRALRASRPGRIAVWPFEAGFPNSAHTWAGSENLQNIESAGLPRPGHMWPDLGKPAERAGEGASLFCEIYPRLFLKRAGFGLRKIREVSGVDTALAFLGSQPARRTGPVSDHEADALVSAAGLRWLADRPAVWSPPAMDARARRQEGWIFGVGDRG